MNRTLRGRLKYLVSSIALLLAAPSVSAWTARTGISPLNSAIEMIGTIFNIEILRQSQAVQIGFLRFMVFVVLLAIIRWSLLRLKAGGQPLFDNKIAGVLAFAIGGIGAFMMPLSLLIVTGGTIQAVAGSIVFIALISLFMYLAFKVFQGNLFMNLIGIMMILLATYIVQLWAMFTGLR